MNEVLDRVPDEFYDWVKKKQLDLIKEYGTIFERAKKEWVDIAVLGDRKTQALKIMKKYPNDASLIFRMLDGDDPSPLIWKQIRPKYEKPFTKDIDI